MQILVEAGIIDSLMDRLSTSEQRNLNKNIIEKIAEIFGGDFSNYIKKKMPTLASRISLLQVLNDYENGKTQDFYKLFARLFIDYYIYASQPSFFKNISGEKKIDIAYQGAIEKYLSQPKVKADIINNMQFFMVNEIPEILDLATINEKSYGNKTKDQIKQVKKGINWLRAKGNKEQRARYELMDGILDYFPLITTKLKRELKSQIEDADITILTKVLKNGVSLNEAIDVSAEIMIPHMGRALYQLKFTDTKLKKFGIHVYKILDSDAFEEIFKKYMKFQYTK